MKAFVIAVVLLTCGFAPWGAERAGAQGVDSCLAYFDTIPHWVPAPGDPPSILRGWMPGNPDSALVDTCSASPTYAEFFIKQWFGIIFDSAIIRLSPAPADSIIEVSWNAIDTNYASTRAGFSALEAKYGTFVLRKDYPSDSGGAPSCIFHIRFAPYVCADSVANALRAIPFVGAAGIIDSLREPADRVVPFEDFVDNNYYLRPNPAHDKIILPFATEGPVMLFDLTGRRLLTRSGRIDELSLDGILPGVYYLQTPQRMFKVIVR